MVINVWLRAGDGEISALMHPPKRLRYDPKTRPSGALNQQDAVQSEPSPFSAVRRAAGIKTSPRRFLHARDMKTADTVNLGSRTSSKQPATSNNSQLAGLWNPGRNV
jgi:hypothetical protein